MDSHINVREILQRFSKTRAILHKYENNLIDGKIVHRRLSNEERRKICNVIIDVIIEEKIILQPKDYGKLFFQISSIFQEEQQSSYYIPATSVQVLNKTTNKMARKQIVASGMLYSVFKYQISKVSALKILLLNFYDGNPWPESS